MSQLSKGKSRAPPTFFPSPSASHSSLPGITTSGISSSAAHHVVGQSQPNATAASVRGRGGGLLRGDPASLTSPTGPMSNSNAPAVLNLNLPLQLPRGESTRATDRTDALWAEMQATLEEVELSASGSTRVFGPDHERKLSELRMAQIALAQAWARSEADDAIETISGHAKSAAGGPDGGGAATDATGKGDTAGGGTTAASTAGTGSARPTSSGMGGPSGQERLGARLEEETEVDILLARKRREANDRYFQRVNQGVLDVVAKLEDVATAMHAVEQESKDVWGDEENDSAPGTSRPTSVKQGPV